MALIVEDGSGLVDAESYASVAEADEYIEKHGNNPAWTNGDKSSGALDINAALTAAIQSQGSVTVVSNLLGDTLTIGSLVLQVANPVTGVTNGIRNAGFSFMAGFIEDIINGTSNNTSFGIDASVELQNNPHPDVTAVAVGDTVTFTAKTAGIVGNLIALSETGTSFTVDGSGTLGGTTLGVDGDMISIAQLDEVVRSWMIVPVLNELVDGQILFDGTLATQRDYIIAAINGDTSSAGVPNAATAHVDVEAIDQSGVSVNVQARQHGAEYNDIETTGIFTDTSNAWQAEKLTGGTPDKEDALRLGTQYIDNQYRGRWKGTRTHESQRLSWPRKGVVDDDDFLVASDVIPRLLKEATIEAALRELTQTDGLMPDITQTGNLTYDRNKVGDLETEQRFLGGKPLTDVFFTIIDNMLSPYLTGGPGQVSVDRG